MARRVDGLYEVVISLTIDAICFSILRHVPLLSGSGLERRCVLTFICRYRAVRARQQVGQHERAVARLRLNVARPVTARAFAHDERVDGVRVHVAADGQVADVLRIVVAAVPVPLLDVDGGRQVAVLPVADGEGAVGIGADDGAVLGSVQQERADANRCAVRLDPLLDFAEFHRSWCWHCEAPLSNNGHTTSIACLPRAVKQLVLTGWRILSIMVCRRAKRHGTPTHSSTGQRSNVPRSSQVDRKSTRLNSSHITISY